MIVTALHPHIPDYEQGCHAVVADRGEPHTERLDLSGQEEEVVHKEISRGLLILGRGGVAGEGAGCPQNPQKLLIF